jgi:acetyl-CoA acetyltransferase
MGIGPLPAVQKLLAKTGLSLDDIDLVEMNEAFASQAVYCQRSSASPTRSST